jgi:hypothetical protein
MMITASNEPAAVDVYISFFFFFVFFGSALPKLACLHAYIGFKGQFLIMLEGAQQHSPAHSLLHFHEGSIGGALHHIALIFFFFCP